VKTSVTLIFTFVTGRFDIDGPIKRTLDAIEKAIKAKGYDWNDLRVVKLNVRKMVGESPGVQIYFSPAYPEYY
jgi:Holliday junction resolvase RusA-like endonuclease